MVHTMAKRIDKTLKNLAPADVKKMLACVEFDLERDDCEAAVGSEYDMWQYVLRATAAGNPDAARLARVALKSTKLKFKWR